MQGNIKAKDDKTARYVQEGLFLLQSKRTNLKRIQIVAGGLVYLFSYRRPLMSCLTRIWQFIISFKGCASTWPIDVKVELWAGMSLLPLAVTDFRLPFDSVIRRVGGGLVVSTGLRPMGLAAAHSAVREGWTIVVCWELVCSMESAALTVALDMLDAPVGGYIAIESDKGAQRVLESNFPDVIRLTLSRMWMIRQWVGGGPSCQGVSGLKGSVALLRPSRRSGQFLMESVFSMAAYAQSIGTSIFGGCPTLFLVSKTWFDWMIPQEEGPLLWSCESEA